MKSHRKSHRKSRSYRKRSSKRRHRRRSNIKRLFGLPPAAGRRIGGF